MKKLAEKYADKLLDESIEADDLERLCCSKDKDWEKEATKFIFDDESVITFVNGGWDVGFMHCWCWQGAGHDEGCQQ